jgi:hypothetical protein
VLRRVASRAPLRGARSRHAGECRQRWRPARVPEEQSLAPPGQPPRASTSIAPAARRVSTGSSRNARPGLRTQSAKRCEQLRLRPPLIERWLTLVSQPHRARLPSGWQARHRLQRRLSRRSSQGAQRGRGTESVGSNGRACWHVAGNRPARAPGVLGYSLSRKSWPTPCLKQGSDWNAVAATWTDAL